MNATIVDVLIENIKTDQVLLEQTETNIEKAKDEKRQVVDRLKDYRRDVSVLLKYADDTQRQKIEALGITLSDTERSMNAIASFVLDTIMKAKDNQLTNGELYKTYAAFCKAKTIEPENYTQFNIKCRSLFNTQRLLRKKGKDAKNSREDIISLNGRVLPKKEDTKPTEKVDNTSDSKLEKDKVEVTKKADAQSLKKEPTPIKKASNEKR